MPYVQELRAVVGSRPLILVAAGALICNAAGDLLLQRRTDDQLWGIPGGSILAMVPVLAAVDLPIEGVGILLAVDTIPDMFRTTANLTGAMTLTAILPSSRDADGSHG